MTAPAQAFTFTWTFTDGILGTHGEPVRCPECGESAPVSITLNLDPAELTDHPSPVVCPWGHQWAEPALPRQYVLGPTLMVVLADPEGLEALALLAAENGGHATLDLNDGQAR